MTYQLAISQASPHSPPVAEVFTACTAAGCDARYLMDPPGRRLHHFPPGWLDAHRPRFDDIHIYAARRDWTFKYGPRCPRHSTSIAIEPPGVAHRRARAITDTAQLPVEEIQAALEEEVTDDAAS